MEASNIYQKYRDCVDSARQIFSYFEKHKTCFEIDSLDKEMHDIFSKIGLTYANFTRSVSTRLNLETPAELLISASSYAYHNKCVEQKSICLDKIATFKDQNEHIIVRILGATLDLTCADGDIASIEYSLGKASQVINRMKMLLKRSQQIYQQNLRISA